MTDLENALREIDADTSLTARQRITERARLMRDYRSMRDRPVFTYGRADRTHPGRAFTVSAARSLGSGIVRAFFKALFGGRR